MPFQSPITRFLIICKKNQIKQPVSSRNVCKVIFEPDDHMSHFLFLLMFSIFASTVVINGNAFDSAKIWKLN